jgi:fimbrial chaperone protein
MVTFTRNKFITIISIFSSAILLLYSFHANSQQLTGGGLRIAPTSLTFEAGERGADLVLRNNSSETATYRIDLVNKVRNAEGRLVEVDLSGPDDGFADQMIRYSPRQITVPGNGSQTVRVAVQRPDGLAPGEYSTRIQFSALPQGRPQAAEDTADGVAFRVEGVMAVTLPITVMVD